MSTTKKPAFAKVMTAKGVFIYPTLVTPDTKFKAEGEFRCRVRLSAEDSAPIIDKHEKACLDQLAATKAELEEKLANAKTGADKGKLKKELAELKMGDKPYKPAFDDEGEETGDYEFNFKMPAQFTSKKDGKVVKMKPDIFDAKGKLMKEPPAIWGGTVGYVAGELRPYYTAKAGVGVSLRLKAVQIIELSSGGGDRSASGYGFGAEDGGYEADESTFGDRSEPSGIDTGSGDSEDF